MYITYIYLYSVCIYTDYIKFILNTFLQNYYFVNALTKINILFNFDKAQQQKMRMVSGSCIGYVINR